MPPEADRLIMSKGNVDQQHMFVFGEEDAFQYAIEEKRQAQHQLDQLDETRLNLKNQMTLHMDRIQNGNDCLDMPIIVEIVVQLDKLQEERKRLEKRLRVALELDDKRQHLLKGFESQQKILRSSGSSFSSKEMEIMLQSQMQMTMAINVFRSQLDRSKEEMQQACFERDNRISELENRTSNLEEKLEKLAPLVRINETFLPRNSLSKPLPSPLSRLQHLVSPPPLNNMPSSKSKQPKHVVSKARAYDESPGNMQILSHKHLHQKHRSPSESSPRSPEQLPTDSAQNANVINVTEGLLKQLDGRRKVHREQARVHYRVGTHNKRSLDDYDSHESDVELPDSDVELTDDECEAVVFEHDNVDYIKDESSTKGEIIDSRSGSVKDTKPASSTETLFPSKDSGAFSLPNKSDDNVASSGNTSKGSLVIVAQEEHRDFPKGRMKSLAAEGDTSTTTASSSPTETEPANAEQSSCSLKTDSRPSLEHSREPAPDRAIKRSASEKDWSTVPLTGATPSYETTQVSARPSRRGGLTRSMSGISSRNLRIKISNELNPTREPSPSPPDRTTNGTTQISARPSRRGSLTRCMSDISARSFRRASLTGAFPSGAWSPETTQPEASPDSFRRSSMSGSNGNTWASARDVSGGMSSTQTPTSNDNFRRASDDQLNLSRHSLRGEPSPLSFASPLSVMGTLSHIGVPPLSTQSQRQFSGEVPHTFLTPQTPARSFRRARMQRENMQDSRREKLEAAGLLFDEAHANSSRHADAPARPGAFNAQGIARQRSESSLDDALIGGSDHSLRRTAISEAQARARELASLGSSLENINSNHVVEAFVVEEGERERTLRQREEELERSREAFESQRLNSVPVIQAEVVDATWPRRRPTWQSTQTVSSSIGGVDLDEIAEKLSKRGALRIKDRVHRFKTYKRCFVTSHAVDFMVDQGLAKSRSHAVALGVALQTKQKFWHHVVDDLLFQDDYLFFRLGRDDDGTGCDFFQVMDWDRPTLESLANQLLEGLVIKDRTFRLRKYKKCFITSEAVDYMVAQGIAKSRAEAVVLGTAFQKELNLWHHVVENHVFSDDYLFFRLSRDENDNITMDKSISAADSISNGDDMSSIRS